MLTLHTALQPKDVVVEVLTIKALVDEGRTTEAHAFEDALFREILQRIIDGEIIKPRRCIQEALKATLIDYERACA